MSANPFRIIRSTDEPPEQLRKDVLGSVRSAILLMRLAQLFVADYAHAIFDKLSAVDARKGGQNGSISSEPDSKPDPS